MMKRIGAALALTLVLAPASARAQIQQVGTSSSEARSTVNFHVGYFFLKSIESRVEDDVLLNNLQNFHPLFFEIDDFNQVVFGGEYLYSFGRHVEAGVGIAYSQRTVHSFYEDLTTQPGDVNIEQDLKLKQVPITFTGRYLILPRGSVVEPYIGGGLVAIRYRYSEVGDFIDPNLIVFPARYVKDGVAVGPMFVGGLRVPANRWTAGFEGRWQKAEGTDLPLDQFLGSKIDLGGWTANFTVGVRF
jgi:hypothetical protein